MTLGYASHKEWLGTGKNKDRFCIKNHIHLSLVILSAKCAEQKNFIINGYVVLPPGREVNPEGLWLSDNHRPLGWLKRLGIQ